MADLVTDFVSVLVIELEEGFQDFKHVEVFMKHNISHLMTIASEPKNAKLTVMLGVPPIMTFVTNCR
jgi:hypothetical protein